MKTIKILMVAVISVAVLDKALAGDEKIFQNKLTCTIKGTQNIFATFYENEPISGSATMQAANGTKTVLQYSQNIEHFNGGCFASDKITKIYFHPYYEIKIEGIHSYGKNNTRCAGDDRPISYSGTYVAEMQKPIELVCEE